MFMTNKYRIFGVIFLSKTIHNSSCSNHFFAQIPFLCTLQKVD